jgi:Asp-tRNA(Asn)/Glu-tRNA(Gln) amidotransferase C subunit
LAVNWCQEFVNLYAAKFIQCLSNDGDVGMEASSTEDVEPADDAWEKHKRLITTLYASWSLDEVQRHLEQCHAFSASYVQLTSPKSTQSNSPIRKDAFKRKLQKWDVKKNATSDKMNRVVESLKRTNRQELIQPCPNKEMVVEGQKVTLSQVKRYIRRNNIPVASQDDTNHEFLYRTADDHPDHAFANGISACSSNQSPLSIYALIEYLSLCLTPEDIMDLSDQLRRLSNTDLHALATGFRHRCMSFHSLIVKGITDVRQPCLFRLRNDPPTYPPFRAIIYGRIYLLPPQKVDQVRNCD